VKYFRGHTANVPQKKVHLSTNKTNKEKDSEQKLAQRDA